MPLSPVLGGPRWPLWVILAPHLGSAAAEAPPLVVLQLGTPSLPAPRLGHPCPGPAMAEVTRHVHSTLSSLPGSLPPAAGRCPNTGLFCL